MHLSVAEGIQRHLMLRTDEVVVSSGDKNEKSRQAGKSGRRVLEECAIRESNPEPTD